MLLYNKVLYWKNDIHLFFLNFSISDKGGNSPDLYFVDLKYKTLLTDI